MKDGGGGGGGNKDWGQAEQAEQQRWLAQPAGEAEAALRQALDHAQERAPDEVALRRVWARVAELPSQLPPAFTAGLRRPRWPWFAAATLAGAAIATVLLHGARFGAGAPGGAATMATTATGTAAVRDDDVPAPDSREARPTLAAPATVRTGVGETLRLTLKGGTVATVSAESALVLGPTGQPAVSVGEVAFHVPRQPPGRTFSLAAAGYKVVVVGTRFRVRVNESATAVSVDEGTVEIWQSARGSNGVANGVERRLARIAAGESWAGSGSATGVAPPSQAVADTPQPEAVTAETTGEPASSPVAGAASAAPRFAARERAREAAAAPRRRSAARAGDPAREARGARRLALATSASRESASGAGPAEQPTAADDMGDLGSQARGARAAGDNRRALALYRALALRGGTAGENAAYEIGKVLRDGLRLPREAIAAWRSYRSQYPRGLLRAEADVSIVETLLAVGEREAALGEASDFLRRHPESERRAEITRLVNELGRGRNRP